MDEQVNVTTHAVNYTPDSISETPDYSAALRGCFSSVEQRELLEVFAPYASTFDFAQNNHSYPVPTSRRQHRINTGDAILIRQKPYRVSPSHREIINDQAEEMLGKGLIRES